MGTESDFLGPNNLNYIANNDSLGRQIELDSSIGSSSPSGGV